MTRSSNILGKDSQAVIELKRLAVIDHSLSAAGVERFLAGLVGGLARHEMFTEWSLALYLSPRNTAGKEVSWTSSLTSDRVKITFFPRKTRSPALDRFFFPRNGLPGTRKIRRVTGEILRKRGPHALRELMGNRRVLTERYLAERPVDVAYFPFPFHLECPRLSVPMVTTVHDFGFWHFERSSRRYFRQMERHVRDFIASSSIVVVSSDFIANEARSLFPWASEKLRVVRPGIPSGPVSPTAMDLERCRRKFELPESFIINVGWIFEHKNQQVILKAIGELKKRGMSLCLLLVGPNTDRLSTGKYGKNDADIDRLLMAASEAGLKPGIDYRGLGYVDDLELECLYRLAEALVVSSLYEAGSFPIIEATRSGCPVICSRIEPYLEQVSLLGNGALTFEPLDHIELADRIQQVLEDREKAREMAERAAALVHQHFSWEKMASGYINAFEEAIMAGGSTKR